MYASLCDFVYIALLLPFVLGFCLSVFVFVFFILSIVFRACYHWWICFLVWLLSSFFLLSFSFISLNFFLFFIFITLFLFIFFILSFFLSPFYSEPCAPPGCQACASEVGEPSSRHWSTRDLPAPRTIKWRKLSYRSPSQR